MRLMTTLIVALACVPAAADEYPLEIETDLKAEYFVVEKDGTPQQPTLLLKRVRAGSTSYSKRLFDCEARASKYLGSGETLEEVAASKPDEEMTPVAPGTIAEQLWKHACGK